MKLCQNVCLDQSQTCLKMGQVRSKTRSVGQILEKSCVRSRGPIFSQIIVKIGQNVCLDKILDELTIGWVGSKIRSLGQILEKPCVYCKGHISVLLS